VLDFRSCVFEAFRQFVETADWHDLSKEVSLWTNSSESIPNTEAKMKTRTIPPAYVVPGKPAQLLDRLPRIHNIFDESFLQKLLADHPELLPVQELRDDAGSLLCIGREVSVSGGTIDNLYLTTAGYPVIVETKLWRNPQARREVLSQTLDYAKDLVQKDFEWFERQWKMFDQQNDSEEGGMVARLSELSDDEIDERFLVDRVHRALSRGDVLAMIVGDGIETRLQDLVAHVCRDSAHLRYSLALVELACFQFADRQSDGILVVPRILQEVEPVQRAYVRVDIADKLKGSIEIASIAVSDEESGNRRRTTFNEEDFFDYVEQMAGEECRDGIKRFRAELIRSFKLQEEFKSAAVMLKVPHPDGEGLGASVLAIERRGRIYNPKFMSGQLKRWGIDHSVVERIVLDYWKSLHDIDPGFELDGIIHVSPQKFLPFMELVERLPEIQACIGKAVREVRSAYENSQ
jgi:hypothetical protein